MSKNPEDTGGRAEELLPQLYTELRRLAGAKMARERPGQTIQATVLVHEAWLRLVGTEDPRWNGRGHFMAAAAEAMRRILVEQARARQRQKRGGDRQRSDAELDQIASILPGEGASAEDVLTVHQALQELAGEDVRKAEIVKLRYFAGLSNEEAAAALEVSVKTIEREWRFLRAWLRERLA